MFDSSLSGVPSVGEPHNICAVTGVILNRAALDNHPNQLVAVLEEVGVTRVRQYLVDAATCHDITAQKDASTKARLGAHGFGR